MKDNHRRIYFSGSWRGASQGLELILTTELAQRDFTLIGDHKIHQTSDTGRNLNWQQRIDDVIAGCHGIVAVMQKTKGLQTTSPYQFPEILMASRHGLPLLVIHPEGVEVFRQRLTESGGHALIFGNAEERTSISLPKRAGDSRELLKDDEFISDEVLNSANILTLPDVPFLANPVEHTESAVTDNLARSIDEFVSHLSKSQPNYVFNIIPFSRQTEHEIIARTVFCETGMPCYRSLDYNITRTSARSDWLNLLSGATFVIADLDTKNRNCLFEVGVAFALSDKLQIVHKGTPRGIPFGLDDANQLVYKNNAELSDRVAQICLPYKRTVFNLKKLDHLSGGEIPGVPDWYTGGEARKDSGVRIQAILLFVAAAALFAVAGYLQKWLPLTIGGIAVAAAAAMVNVFSGLVPKIRDDMDKFFVRNASRLRRAGGFLLALAVATCIISIWYR